MTRLLNALGYFKCYSCGRWFKDKNMITQTFYFTDRQVIQKRCTRCFLFKMWKDLDDKWKKES